MNTDIFPLSESLVNNKSLLNVIIGIFRFYDHRDEFTEPCGSIKFHAWKRHETIAWNHMVSKTEYY